MRLEDYFDFHTPDDIRLKGTRVGIETVLYAFIYQSRSPEEIATRYPSLTLEQVYATITYYLHNQEDVRAYLTRWIDHGERMRAEQERNLTATTRRLRQLRATQQVTEKHDVQLPVG